MNIFDDICADCTEEHTPRAKVVCRLNQRPLCEGHFQGRMREAGQLIVKLLEKLHIITKPGR